MRLRYFALALLVGCAGGNSDTSSGLPDQDPGSGSGGGTGNGVSFGGAQDIGEFRAALDRGEVPTPEMFDANGFFNEHYNEPPQIGCGGTLCLTPGLSVGKDWRTGAYQAALQVSMATYIDPAQYTRLPMKLVVVVDHSGSMASDMRLEKVKAGLHTLIDNLRDEDRMAIISFGDTVSYDAPFASTDEAGLDRAKLHDVVDSLVPNGGTNIYDGLHAGLTMLGEEPSNERQNRVIFLSDGLATVGNTSQQAIIEMALGYIERGIGLTTIGVGNDFDVVLMRGLAEFGAGNFYFIEDAAAATEVFTEELDYFMSPLALDVQIDVIAAEGWQLGRVRGSRTWQATTRDGSMQIPAVFLASRVGQEPGPDGRRGGGSMIFIDLTPLTNRAGEVATLELSYRPPGQADRVTHRITLDYDRDPQEQLEEPYLSYPGMAERYAMFNMFLGLDRATRHAARQSDDCAAAMLAATSRYARQWQATHSDDPDIAADIALVDQFQQLLVARGANLEANVGACADVDDPLPTDDRYGDDYGDDHVHYGCMSASPAAGGTWLVLASLGFVVVRRRRRR